MAVAGRSTDGVWLSLVERLVWGQEVPGSNPGYSSTPTIFLRIQGDANAPSLVAQVAQRRDLLFTPGNDEHVAGIPIFSSQGDGGQTALLRPA